MRTVAKKRGNKDDIENKQAWGEQDFKKIKINVEIKTEGEGAKPHQHKIRQNWHQTQQQHKNKLDMGNNKIKSAKG